MGLNGPSTYSSRPGKKSVDISLLLQSGQPPYIFTMKIDPEKMYNAVLSNHVNPLIPTIRLGNSASLRYDTCHLWMITRKRTLHMIVIVVRRF